MRRHQAAIAAGVDPTALVEVINAAQAEREAARAALASAGNVQTIDRAEVYAMINSLGDVGETLKDAKQAGLARLYEELRLQLRYEPQEQAVYVTAKPRVVSERVRGGTETLIPRRFPVFPVISMNPRLAGVCVVWSSVPEKWGSGSLYWVRSRWGR